MEQLNHVAAQVRDIIVSRIESHEYLPGEMIPSERVLAEMYGVSRPTIRTAIDELVNEHYLVRRQGKGTFVKKPEYNKVAFGVLNESKSQFHFPCPAILESRYPTNYCAPVPSRDVIIMLINLVLHLKNQFMESTVSARVTKSHWLLSTLTFH